MNLSTLPHLSQALALLAVDIGAILNKGAEFPDKWSTGAQTAEGELAKFDTAQVEAFVAGEEMEQEQLRPLAPEAHRLICDAFDGDLSDLLFAPLTGAFDYFGVEELSDELTKQKQLLQQKGK